MNSTLSIFVTAECNFSCDHCLVCRDQGSFGEITDADIERIGLFCAAAGITDISFTGGEPTLRVGIMEKIQQALGMSYRYSVNTNGWCGDNPGLVLDRVKLDKVFVSYDPFHSANLGMDRILDFVLAAKQGGVPVGIKSSTNQPLDILALQPFAELDCEILVSPVTREHKPTAPTKSQDITAEETKVWSSHCPARYSAGEPGDQSFFFVAGRGFTRCHGSLLFCGDKVKSHHGFAAHYDQLMALAVGRFCSETSFDEFLGARGLDRKDLKFGDEAMACDICYFLHAEDEASGVPSVVDILGDGPFPKFFPAHSRLEEARETLLLSRLDIDYVFHGRLAIPDSLKDVSLDPAIQVRDAKRLAATALFDFYQKNYHPFSSKATPAQQERVDAEMRGYFAGSWIPWEGVALMLGETIVGLITTSSLDDVLLQRYKIRQASRVVGYIGYDRTHISKSQSLTIKRHFFNFLEGSSKDVDQHVTHSISAYNEPSLRWAKSIGLAVRGISIREKI